MCRRAWRRERTTGAVPIPTTPTTASTRPVADSNYHGLHVSFIQRPAAWGYYRVSYTLSKSMNNVGENFFSSPIDPFDLSKDWGRSDDDQRHRLALTAGGQHVDGAGARRVGAADARLSVQQHGPGVLGAAVQHHVRRDDDPGNARPANSRWRVHPAQCRRRQRLLLGQPAREPRVSRHRAVCGSKAWSKCST